MVLLGVYRKEPKRPTMHFAFQLQSRSCLKKDEINSFYCHIHCYDNNTAKYCHQNLLHSADIRLSFKASLVAAMMDSLLSDVRSRKSSVHL